MRFTAYHWFIYASGGLFAAHQLTQKVLEIHVPILDNYLDPFLGVILFLHLIKIDPFQVIHFQKITILFSSLLFMFLSEVLFPALCPAKFVIDWWDLISIAVGAITYLIVFSKTH